MTGETVIIDLTMIPNDANEVTVNESADGSIVNFDKLDEIESQEQIAQPEGSEGLAVSTYVIAIFATIGVLLMVVLAVLALRRGIKAKGEIANRTSTAAAEAAVTRRSNKPTNDLENSNGYTSGATFQSPDQSKH